jgi:hypothetical protein
LKRGKRGKGGKGFPLPSLPLKKVNILKRNKINQTLENMIIVYFISKSECEKGKGGKGFPLPSLPLKSKYLRRKENHIR